MAAAICHEASGLSGALALTTLPIINTLTSIHNVYRVFANHSHLRSFFWLHFFKYQRGTIFDGNFMLFPMPGSKTCLEHKLLTSLMSFGSLQRNTGLLPCCTCIHYVIHVDTPTTVKNKYWQHKKQSYIAVRQQTIPFTILSACGRLESNCAIRCESNDHM